MHIYIHTFVQLRDNATCMYAFVFLYVYSIYIHIYLCIHTYTISCIYTYKKVLIWEELNDIFINVYAYVGICVFICISSYLRFPTLFARKRTICIRFHNYIHLCICMFGSPVVGKLKMHIYFCTCMSICDIYTHIYTYVCMCIYTHIGP